MALDTSSSRVEIFEQRLHVARADGVVFGGEASQSAPCQRRPVGSGIKSRLARDLRPGRSEREVPPLDLGSPPVGVVKDDALR